MIAERKLDEPRRVRLYRVASGNWVVRFRWERGGRELIVTGRRQAWS